MKSNVLCWLRMKKNMVLSWIEKQAIQRRTRCFGRIFSWHRFLYSFRLKDQKLIQDGAHLELNSHLYRKIMLVFRRKMVDIRKKNSCFPCCLLTYLPFTLMGSLTTKTGVFACYIHNMYVTCYLSVFVDLIVNIRREKPRYVTWFIPVFYA